MSLMRRADTYEPGAVVQVKWPASVARGQVTPHWPWPTSLVWVGDPAERPASRTTEGLRMNRSNRRIAVLTGMMAIPIAVGTTVGAGTASADEWHYGPVYRSEYSGEAGQYLCGKAQALEQASRSIILVPCTNVPDTDAWYRIVLNPYNWEWSG